MRTKAALLCLGAKVLFVLGFILPTLAKEEGGQASSQNHYETQESPASKIRTGYQDVPQFGGENSVAGQLKKDDKVTETVYRFETLQRALKPYFDFKKDVNQNYGFAFGTDYTLLYQGANVSLGENQAAGGIFRIFGVWTLFGRESGNTGNLVYKVENRHAVGTNIPPQGLGFQLGYANLTAAPFSDFGWGVTNLYWQQRFFSGRMSIIAGVVDSTDYVNLYGLINPWTAFSNLAFLTGSTIPVPNQGIGTALGAMAAENIYVLAGFTDANGDATTTGLDTFFNDNEYFYHLEVGWVSSFARRYLDNIHITAWYANKREQAQVQDGWGLAFSAAWFVRDRWMPFLRGGYAAEGGALYDRSISAGLGYYLTRRRDLLGVGFNWGQPSDSTFPPGLRDEYTTEFFYRVQFSPNFALTPDIQVLIDPSLNPDNDVIGVFGVRARLAL